MATTKLILLTGATGYIGGRLLKELEAGGRAWLEFEVQPAQDGVTLRQTATFDPLGLAGLAYWYALFPLHELVFRGMIRNLGRAVKQ